jgi:hypothetical protein
VRSAIRSSAGWITCCQLNVHGNFKWTEIPRHCATMWLTRIAQNRHCLEDCRMDGLWMQRSAGIARHCTGGHLVRCECQHTTATLHYTDTKSDTATRMEDAGVLSCYACSEVTGAQTVDATYPFTCIAKGGPEHSSGLLNPWGWRGYVPLTCPEPVTLAHRITQNLIINPGKRPNNPEDPNR